MKKKRKQRTTGSNLDFDVSHIFGWPPEYPSTPAYEKLYHRIDIGQCIGCGKEMCDCKSGHMEGPSWKTDPYVLKNFWKKFRNEKRT